MSSLILGVFAITSYKEYISFGRNHRHVKKLFNTIDYTQTTIRYLQRLSLANREFIHLDPNSKWTPFQDSYITALIVVVGETTRVQNVGYTIWWRENDDGCKSVCD